MLPDEATYLLRFGPDNGKYLSLLSQIKNTGIRAGRQDYIDKWLQARQVVLDGPQLVWNGDDPVTD